MSSGSGEKVSRTGNALRDGLFHNGNMLKPKRTLTKLRRPTLVYLKEWLAYRKLTAEQLAAKMETSKSVVSKLMTGAQRYNDDWLARIAAALGCEVLDLYHLPPTSPATPTANELLAQMPPEIRETAMNVLMDLARWKPDDRQS